jgi:hypothetical protein
MPEIVSANRLTDGIVVFLAKDDSWVETLAGAELFSGKPAVAEGLKRAEAAMARNLVVEILAVEVETTPRGIEPRHIRDRIRAAGPTVHRDHGKQAVAAAVQSGVSHVSV